MDAPSYLKKCSNCKEDIKDINCICDDCTEEAIRQIVQEELSQMNILEMLDNSINEVIAKENEKKNN